MRLTVSDGEIWTRRGVGRSIGGAFVLLAWDGALTGWVGMSFLVCPIWFLVSILKNAIRRPGWRLALLRIAVPPLTLGLVLANNSVQYRIGKENSARVVTACEAFHVANGRYPLSLEELVPRYFPSVPRAKHCMVFGEFWYWNKDGSTKLVWYVAPPYGRKIYSFEERRWSYLD